MRNSTSAWLAAASAAALLLAAPVAAQATPREETFLTFDHAVRLPDATLPAGTYQFRLADDQGDQHVVQVLNRRGTKLFATELAVPVTRERVAGEPTVTLASTGHGAPAITEWFYPGAEVGQQFVYPAPEEHELRLSGDTVVQLGSPQRTEHVVRAPALANGAR
ncbi:MAG: hypothetical protein AB7O67_16225 [Vicinamibacterales bacterium]